MIEHYVCTDCGKTGEVVPQDAVDNRIMLLSEDSYGNLVCLPCYMKQESMCHHCGDETELFPQKQCRAEPLICEECLALPFTIHMDSCYGDGCMTPGEFAEETARLESYDEDETFLEDLSLQHEERDDDYTSGCSGD